MIEWQHDNNLVKDALDILATKWKINPKLYDFQTGSYKEAVSDTQVNVGGTTFHIPTLSKDGLYILWNCLWPDCHNCCERQGRLPLTKDDIGRIAKKVGYGSEAEFVRNETTISRLARTGSIWKCYNNPEHALAQEEKGREA